MYDVLLEMKELSGKLQSPKLDYLKAAYDLIKGELHPRYNLGLNERPYHQ